MDGQPLEGRTALVTGASRGIGAAVAKALADAGARVWLVARSADALRRVAEEVGGSALVADLSDEASLWEAVERFQEEAGGAPDVVVNAAGVFALSPVAGESVASLDRHLAVNLRASFLMARAVLPAMLQRGSGVIVNVGSVAGRKAFPGNAAYSASKFGLRGFHEVLLEELRGTGVRATLVEPAATDTPLWDPLDPDADPGLPDRAAMLSAGDVAEAVVFIASRPATVRIPVLQIERA